MVKIFLDPGHGGHDSGAIGNGLYEKTLNLEIAKKIQNQLNDYENVEVKMSRSDDRYLTLKERTDLANNWDADLYLSVHINSSEDVTANGFESYIYNGNVTPRTQAYQNVVHAEIVKQITGIRDRGKQKANFAVLRQSLMPAILTENLFIVNKSDSLQLKKDSFLENLATGHVLAFEKFLGLKRKVTEPNTASIPTGKLFKVQVGAFEDKENAKNTFEKLLKDGYEAYIIEE